ncbi:MAG: type IV secretion system protein [Alphaproteobacteria bacterium]|nr:type IV secretion system protein [Alphaproteobacteria bacterium]MCL2881155.1 type IV secretion system protein [Treponema sp.]
MAVIEPQVLTARMMSFVFAVACATALAMVLSLSNMFPLSRTQVFLLNTKRVENQIIEIRPLPVNDKTLNAYKESFIKEYIRARNEIVPDVRIMRLKWRSPEGSVYQWSTREVYARFTNTLLWSAFMKDTPDPLFSCPVEFQRIEPRGNDRFAVNFRWFCTSDSAGQTTAKDFTIVVGLTSAQEVKWGARLENPLGIQVSEYKVEVGGGDPLDFVQ